MEVEMEVEMGVEFFSPEGRSEALKKLEESISKNAKTRLAIVSAFCTKAGVNILLPHANLLDREDSFLVVSSEKPTDLEALEELHTRAQDSIYVHMGASSPEEIGNNKPYNAL